MHFLRRHILKTLTTEGESRYSELRPEGVASNQFSYHITALLKDGFIRKKADFYVLSPKGKAYAEKVNLESFRVRSQPKIVTMLYCTNNKGEVLFFRRARQPFFGLVSLPFGKVHLHEKIGAAAARELHEKTGLKGNVRHRGDAYLAIYENDELLTHMLCHVFSAHDVAGTLAGKGGSCFWAHPRKIERDDAMPGLFELLKLLAKSKTHFFGEYFLEA